MKTLKFFTLLFTLLLVSSCEENNNLACNVENPLENLAFLKEAKNTINSIDCGGKSSIIQYTYNGETVFYVNVCDAISDGQSFVYNCLGEKICRFGGIAGENTCPDFEKTATDKIILYGS